MRSVERGPWPTENGGRRKSFSNYRRARIPLVERLGEFCSYCERPCDPDVEHVVPKSSAQELESEWSNFLLGCRNCNSRKWNRNTTREGYLWPDYDDTFGAFVYRSGGRVSVSSALSRKEQREATALYNLVGLGKSGTDTDRRRHKRRQAWDKAVMTRRLIRDEASQTLAVEIAVGTGFFSVWMTVFHEDREMRRRLIAAFPGTRSKRTSTKS